MIVVMMLLMMMMDNKMDLSGKRNPEIESLEFLRWGVQKISKGEYDLPIPD